MFFIKVLIADQALACTRLRSPLKTDLQGDFPMYMSQRTGVVDV